MTQDAELTDDETIKKVRAILAQAVGLPLWVGSSNGLVIWLAREAAERLGHPFDENKGAHMDFMQTFNQEDGQ